MHDTSDCGCVVVRENIVGLLLRAAWSTMKTGLLWRVSFSHSSEMYSNKCVFLHGIWYTEVIFKICKGVPLLFTRIIKVGQPWITNLRNKWKATWARSKCKHDWQKKVAPNCFLYLIMQILVPQLKSKFAPSPRLHLQSDHINTHTKQVETLHMDLYWDHFQMGYFTATHPILKTTMANFLGTDWNRQSGSITLPETSTPQRCILWGRHSTDWHPWNKHFLTSFVQISAEISVKSWKLKSL